MYNQDRKHQFEMDFTEGFDSYLLCMKMAIKTNLIKGFYKKIQCATEVGFITNKWNRDKMVDYKDGKALNNAINIAIYEGIS